MSPAGLTWFLYPCLPRRRQPLTPGVIFIFGGFFWGGPEMKLQSSTSTSRASIQSSSIRVGGFVVRKRLHPVGH
jgi:hypothetical protein